MLVWVRVFLYALIVVVGGAALIVAAFGPERGVRILEDFAATKVGGPFAMVDHDGRAVTDADYRGRYMVVFFGFTNCPDVCPTELQTVTAALDSLPKPTLEKIQPLFVTVDDERDTPAAMKAYLANFHPRFIGLTGTAAQIEAIKKVYRAYAAKGERNKDGEFMIEHAGFLYVMGPDGKFAEVLKPGLKPDELAAKLRRTVG